MIDRASLSLYQLLSTKIQSLLQSPLQLQLQVQVQSLLLFWGHYIFQYDNRLINRTTPSVSSIPANGN
jgi:hypothetical protein